MIWRRKLLVRDRKSKATARKTLHSSEFSIHHTFADDSVESTAVREWLLDHYQTQLYPIGRPTSKKEASLPSRGKSAKGRYKKACERMVKNWLLVTVLKKQTLKDVLQRL